MLAFHSDTFTLPLPESHRFPMAKYARLRERLLAERILPPGSLRIPEAATRSELALVHDPEYVDRVFAGTLTAAEVRAIGFPWSTGLVERSVRSVGATLAAARAALADGIAVNLAGGTHHASRDRGEGYCVFNDVAVAARVLRAEGIVRRIAIVDLDVHQGNGTAAIFSGEPDVFTLSLHGANNFPFRKVDGDLDLALPDGTDDGVYLAALSDALARLDERFDPEFVFYLAGADPYRGDRFGRLALSKAALAERDRRVFERYRGRGLAVAVAMAGGYAPDVEDIVDIHAETVRLAAAFAGVAC